LDNNKHHTVTRSKASIFKPKIDTVITFESSEPNSLKEALAEKDWFTTMQLEYDALVKNNTRTLIDLPLVATSFVVNGSTRINTMHMVFFNVTRLTLVAKGFHQTPGLDYTETLVQLSSM